MKNFKHIRSWAVAFALLLCTGFAMVACSKDDQTDVAVVKQGVQFNFKRKIIYAATGVNQIGSVKITLSDGTKKIVLPSSKVKGDEDIVTTNLFTLSEGAYELIAYSAYDQKHNWLFDMELDSLNQFSVQPQKVSTFVVPVKTRNVLNNNFIRSALMGICLEVFGEDETTWPWNPEEYPYPDWEGLEFEVDDYGTPMFVSGIFFDGYRDGKPTPWAKMKELPEGTVSALTSLYGLTFTDMPEFTTIAGDLENMPALAVITCVNTGVEHLPANISKLKALSSLTIIDSPFKEIPAGISDLSELRLLHLRGTQITSADLSLQKLTKLESLDLGNNPLTSIGEQLLPIGGNLYELSLDNTELSTLPASLGRVTSLRGLYLQNCKFTSIPAPVKGNPAILSIHLDGNPIQSIAASDLQLNVNLESLSLNGIKISTLPSFQLPNLKMLNVVGCGLTVAPNLSSLPALRIFNAGDNKFSTLPANYFALNTKIRNISFANSPSLISMPSGDLGLKPIVDGKEGFKWLNVEGCPALNWTTPVAWKSFDQVRKDYKPKTRRPDFPEGDIYDEYYGRVAVNREGSSGVQFGK